MIFLSSDAVADIISVGRAGIHDAIAWYRDRAPHGLSTVKLKVYRQYIAGDQKITLTSDQKDLLAGLLGNEYCDNVLNQIVSEAAARLQLLEWSCDDEATKKFLDDTYIRANTKSVSTKVHYDMLGDGNTCLSMRWDDRAEQVRMYRELWWDSDNGIFVVHDPEDPEKITLAVKEWGIWAGSANQYWRRVVWIEGEIQRWRSDDRINWIPYSLPDDPNNSGVLEWLDEKGEPMAPPIIHFPNCGSTTREYGLSEIAGGFVGAQDRLNDTQYIISVAGRLTGYQMYTIAGAKKDLDENGVEKPLILRPGAVLKSTSPDTKYGTLPPGDLTQLIGSYDHQIKTIARNAKIPLHRLGQGNPPSGEALMRAEGPAINKAERQVDVCVPRWGSAGHIARKMHNRFAKNSPKVNPDVTIRAIMEQPDRKDKLSKSVIVANLGDRISTKEALRIMEYPDDMADKIYEEIVQEAQDKSQVLIDQALATAPPPVPGGPGGTGGGGVPKGKPSPPKPTGKVSA